MMHRRNILISAAAIFIASTMPTMNAMAAAPSLELFGTQLKNAKRDQLRQVFKQGGMSAVREDLRYWVDTYNSNGVLEGASQFEAGYVSKTGQFAYARYTFPGFMNAGLVKNVIDLVASKYGQPASKRGRYDLGPVTATWKVAQNMKIEVSRGWPDTTTYLAFIDNAANQAMDAEIDAERKRQKQQKAQAQSKAF
ncbi:hypothetical protein [Castellaniella sp.]|uniref:hypothetical protein n=1 Tax=Castellaniella sp. TaxID=1955812 RepID=UPI002AFED3E4|nr:hypothetical protein [Castellaniella sp.]